MKNILLLFLNFYLIIMSLTACGKNVSLKEELFQKEYVTDGIKNVNTDIQITRAIDTSQHHYIGEEINYDGINKSENRIYFPPDDNLKIIYFDKAMKKWVTIPNSDLYGGEGTVNTPRSQGGLGLTTISFMPKLNENKAIELRIIVIGNIMDGETVTDMQVMAYLDILVEPGIIEDILLYAPHSSQLFIRQSTCLSRK